MKHLRTTAGEYKTLITVYLMMGLVQSFLQNFSASYFQTVIDNFSGNVLTITNIAVYGTTMISLYIISYLDEYTGRKLENGIKMRLKTIALRKMSVIDYQAYVKLGTGTLIQRIENGASSGCSILFGFYLRLAGELLPSMILSAVFVFAINRAVMAAVMCGYIIVFIITNILLKILYKVKESILVNEEIFNHLLVRGFMEMVVFRVNRRFANEINKAETVSDGIVSAKVKMALIHEAFFTIFAVLVGFVKIGIIIYGWTEKTLTIGEVVALIALIDNAYTPVAILNVLYVQYKLDKVAFARYAEFLDSNEDRYLTHGKDIAGINGNISFSNIDFRYGEREIFKGFNLIIEQGKSTAFVGESGSGKSTALKLLTGLLHPCGGSIEAGKYNLDRINLNSYYNHIAYLTQEPPVFDGTLRENLVFDELYDGEVLFDAIKHTGLEELFKKLENGFDTRLGERGAKLSGGERQQIALARLWFTNAGIIILDEATSAIDNLTEERVMTNVMSRLSGKTVIAVAHRLDSVRAFDDIVVFRDGCVAERGRFEELINNRGYFYELYSRQSGQ